MQKPVFKFFLLIIYASFFVASCTHRKNLIYFQGSMGNTDGNKIYNPVLRNDDLLSILVMDMDDAAVRPFNIPLSYVSQNIGGYTQGAPSPSGYLIDCEGNIDFPVLGKIKLAGLSRSQAIDTIKIKLKSYLAHPSVLIRIQNFKVTVLGEVRNPGTFTIPNERITLPEAIGIAGDLLITGVRKNVLIVREVDGKTTETRVDLRSRDLFSSPFYYLQQNDLIYVEPNRAKINSSVINPSNISIGVSVISLLVTMAVLFIVRP